MDQMVIPFDQEKYFLATIIRKQDPKITCF